MVQLRWAHLTEQAVRAMGFTQYAFKEYRSMGHSSCDQVNTIYSRNFFEYILSLL